MFGNRMQTSAIPERVYALCREVAGKPMDENTLKLLLEPQNLGGKTPYEKALWLYGKEFLKKLQLRYVAPDEVTLTPKLLTK